MADPTLQVIRRLRETALYLDQHADAQRQTVVAERGVRRYLFDVLGREAKRPVTGMVLIWVDRVECPQDGALLADYLEQMTRRGAELPKRILCPGGKWLYL